MVRLFKVNEKLIVWILSSYSNEDLRLIENELKSIEIIIIYVTNWANQDLFDLVFSYVPPIKEIHVYNCSENNINLSKTCLFSLHKCSKNLEKFTFCGQELREYDIKCLEKCNFYKLNFLKFYTNPLMSMLSGKTLKTMILANVKEDAPPIDMTHVKGLTIKHDSSHLAVTGDLSNLLSLDMNCNEKNYKEFKKIIKEAINLQILSIDITSPCIQYELILNNHPTLTELHMNWGLSPKKIISDKKIREIIPNLKILNVTGGFN